MSKKRPPMKPKDAIKRLKAEGWTVKRKGPGDHVQYTHPNKPGKVTIDTGAREIPTGTLRSVFKQAGWEW